MTRPNNVVVAQSGGPTPVINASLRGVVDGCRDFPGVFGTVYAGFHGIEGVLKEELLNLSDRIREMILDRRPASEVKKAAHEEGMRFLRESAVEKVLTGLTTLREINKVTFVE